MTLQKPVGGADDAPLLGQGYAFRTAAMAVIPAVPDLGEYQCISIPHDQVDFATTHLVVSLQRCHAAPVQERFRDLLPVAASLACVCHKAE
jgi:hypothetical protein